MTENFTRREKPRYREIAGATVEHPEEATAGQYFSLVWTDEMWDRLVQETNLDATQEREKNPPPPSAPKWTAVKKNEMKEFIRLCFAMGVMRMPTKSDYWRQNRFLQLHLGRIWQGTDLCRFGDTFTCKTMQNSHSDHIMWEIRWFVDFLHEKFKELYVPYDNANSR